MSDSSKSNDHPTDFDLESAHSSSTGSPVRRGRGQRGRGRGRAAARRPRSRSGGSRTRGRGRGYFSTEEETEGLLARQKEEMKAQVDQKTIIELLSILHQAIDLQPGIMMDIMRPAQQQSGGFHPGPGSAVPDWCVCGFCREMPTPAEEVCCQKAQCVSGQADFEIFILHEGVLALARMYRRDILVFDDDEDINKANRHQAYRQFILYIHGRLTAGDRRVIPSCCVWKIRDKFPDAFGQYQGFVPSRLVMLTILHSFD